MAKKSYNIRLDAIEKERFEALTKELGFDSVASHIRNLMRKAILDKDGWRQLTPKGKVR